MGTSNYSDEFKRDAVHQIMVRGYAVREVSGRLGVSTHSLYKWIKLFGGPEPVIPPFLEGCIRRIHAAIFSFWAGVMPPMPMLGRSLL